MKKRMLKKSLSAVFSVLVFVTLGYAQSNKSPLQKAELYITPRNVEYSWADGGVFQFRLNRASVKFKYDRKRYKTLTVKDSVYELFYTKLDIPTSLYSNLMPNKENTVWTKRIMILLPNQDTFYIDQGYNLIKNEKSYQLSDEFRNLIEGCMPIEIRENWILNLSRFRQTWRNLDYNNDSFVYRKSRIDTVVYKGAEPILYLQNGLSVDTIDKIPMKDRDTVISFTHNIGSDTSSDIQYKFDETFYINGIKRSEATYINGEIFGMARGWYTSGKLHYVFFSEGGSYFGPYLKNYPNGNIEEFGYYKLPPEPTKYQRAVKRAATSNSYDIYSEYVQLKDGTWKTYYKHGVKKSEETYSEGLKDGLFKYYDMYGSINRTELYVQDKLIEIKSYPDTNSYKH